MRHCSRLDLEARGLITRVGSSPTARTTYGGILILRNPERRDTATYVDYLMSPMDDFDMPYKV
jgi:hypothetical protein